MKEVIEVLIVEDDARIAKIHEKFIEKMDNFLVVGCAHSIDDAKIWIETLQPDLVLLDVFFPNQLGVDLLPVIKEKSVSTDVIFITAAAEAEIIKKAFMSGATNYLLKPLTFERFKYCLEDYRQKRELLNQTGKLNMEEIELLWNNPLMESQQLLAIEDVPKGIDPLTKRKVLDYIETCMEGITAEKLGTELGISRSTARRYLEYLVVDKKVRTELIYGTVGRPERRYFNMP